MTLQMCQFAFYTLAFASAAISLTLMYMGVVYYPGVAWLGLIVTLLGLVSSIGYLYLGQRMLGRQHEAKLYRALLLAVVFPSGLILANTRATFEAFFCTRMDFNRTTRVGEIHEGRLARRARTGGRRGAAGLRLRRIQLERAVLLLRRLRPGLHRRHGRASAPAPCASRSRRASEPLKPWSEAASPMRSNTCWGRVSSASVRT